MLFHAILVHITKKGKIRAILQLVFNFLSVQFFYVFFQTIPTATARYWQKGPAVKKKTERKLTDAMPKRRR